LLFFTIPSLVSHFFLLESSVPPMIHSLLTRLFVFLQPFLCVFGVASWLFVYSMILVTPLIMYRRYHKERQEAIEQHEFSELETNRKFQKGKRVLTERERVHKKEPRSQRSTKPFVSILRPLKGLDTNLALNLESTFQQMYPNFELIFCLESALDPAYAVVQELMIQYPQVQARIVLGTVD
jgi:hypothetical protein